MNRLRGKVASIEAAGGVALVDVDVGNRRFTAMLVCAEDEAARWHPGTGVTLLFQEAEVSLAKNLAGAISMRNRLPGTITAIERGRLLTRVAFDVDGHPVVAVITTRSCDNLRLAAGDAVEGLVKANEMSLQYESAA
jgi:molybdate transport system regulatory protein